MAYRRVHLQAKEAEKSSTCTTGMLLFALHMTFGGARNPSQWSDVSEVIVSLANGLMRISNCPQAGGLADERGGRQ